MHVVAKTSAAIGEKIIVFLFVLVAMGVPLYFLPFTGEMFETNKRLLLVVTGLLAVVAFVLSSFAKKRFSLAKTPWMSGYVLLIATTLLSVILSSSNKLAGLTSIAGALIALSLLYLIATTLIKREIETLLLPSLMFSAIVVTFFAILDRVGLKAHTLINTITNSNLTDSGFGVLPLGSPYLAVVFLFICFVYFLSTVIVQKDKLTKAVAVVACAVTVVGLLLSLEPILPGKPQAPIFASFGESWSVALDVLKNPKTAIVGVGPEHYNGAYNAFKPASSNIGERWMVQFGTGRNLILDGIVTHGALSILTWVAFALGFVALIPKLTRQDLSVFVTILVCIGTLLLFPPNLIVYTLLTIFLITLSIKYNDHAPEHEFILLESVSHAPKTSLPVVGIVAIVLMVLVAVLGYFVSRSFASSLYYGSALQASRENDGKETYEQMALAIQLNPYSEEARRAFALTNIALAQSLTKKEDVTEADRKTILALVQQAIREAKIAASLNPSNPANWETLANVYATLIGSAEQAGEWTIAAQVRAIQAAPTNPQLRFNLATTYQRLKQDEQALRMFEQAIQLKGDFANAYYNIAAIYKARGDKQRQLVFLDQTLSLVKTTSKDYDKLKKEADALRAQVDSEQKALQQATSSAQLREPTPAQEKVDVEVLTTPAPASPSAVNVPLTPQDGIASPSGVPEPPQE